MLPARYRMRRSAEFTTTVGHGTRSVQPDVVIHAYRGAEDQSAEGPRIGLVVAKSVGNSVERHRVARRLRHIARGFIKDLDAADRVVIRARPGSRYAVSAKLEKQVRIGLARTRPKVTR